MALPEEAKQVQPPLQGLREERGLGNLNRSCRRRPAGKCGYGKHMASNIQRCIQFLVDGHQLGNRIGGVAYQAFKRGEVMENLSTRTRLLSNSEQFHHPHRVSKLLELAALVCSERIKGLAAGFSA